MASVSLNIGLKALLTAQSSLDTVGHNVSNANTPGYSRQHLAISASPAIHVRGLLLGNGVDANVVLRTADDLLTRRLVLQTSSIQQLEARVAGMAHVESLLAEPGEGGLNAMMEDLFASLSSLAASPDDGVLRTGVVQSAQSLAGRFHELAGGLATARADAARQIEVQVERVNALTERIAALNHEIAGFEAVNGPANDLRDGRDAALRELGGLLQIAYHEDAQGFVTVQASGAVLVGTSGARKLASALKADGVVDLTVAGHARPLEVRGGTLGGLVQLRRDFVPALRERFDVLARNLILELNRAHSTGIPASGAFRALTGEHAIEDTDGDGDRTDELLASAGLPFEVREGALQLNVADDETGELVSTRIAIDPATTTVGDLLDAIDAAAHVSASLDSSGRIQIAADVGHRFDFSRRVNPRPDALGTLGGAAATLGAGTDGPYALAHGQTLSVAAPGGPVTVTFDAADFEDIGQASAGEIAAAMNADPALNAAGMRAVVAGGRVFLQSLATGSSATFTVTGGTAASALGWTPGTSATGQTHTVDVRVTGVHEGDTDARYTLVPLSDGTIGTTAGLQIAVFDASGGQVATLDVGEGYEPGTELRLPNGLSVAFGLGTVSATNHERATIDAVADSDTSDVLVALGLNGFLSGRDASDIALRRDLELDPDLVASSMTGAEGDNTILNDMLAAQRRSVENLGDRTLGEFYGDVVGGVGFDIETARSAAEVEQYLHDSLEQRRQEIAGVNVDEELVNMIRFQQSYGAAAQFIQLVNRTQDDLLAIL
jgi:flagellar hook-associated protein FlgK